MWLTIHKTALKHTSLTSTDCKIPIANTHKILLKADFIAITIIHFRICIQLLFVSAKYAKAELDSTPKYEMKSNVEENQKAFGAISFQHSHFRIILSIFVWKSFIHWFISHIELSAGKKVLALLMLLRAAIKFTLSPFGHTFRMEKYKMVITEK